MKWFFKCSKIKKLRNLILPFCDFLPGPPPPTYLYYFFLTNIDTTNTHYRVSKFLTNLLNPQIPKIFLNSFEAVNMIHKIPLERFDQGYQYFSLEVTSLFTNVLLKKTINITVGWIHK